ncbi:MAG: thiamine pyrophosphokinase [Syntrophus sp. SKADARSKE-3]|nr:thiamine pyrophosphokinase [Syntrophus sp. SKADARSKE-3]
MSENRRVVVLAGGEIQDHQEMRSRIDDFAPDAIVCADGGARHARAMDLVPSLIVGDMDSLAPDLLARFADQGVEIRRVPVEKDETDTELAFAAALEIHPAEILVTGALGYRLDHTLANLSLLLKGEKHHISVTLADEWCEVFLATGMCTITGRIGQTVSLLPFFGEAKGVSLSGFQYSLDGATLSMEAPYGISNRLVSEKGTIIIGSGRLVVIRFFGEDLFPG